MLSRDQLSLIGLALVVAFGIGFLLWAFAHMLIELHPHSKSVVRLFRPARPRRRT